MFAVTVASRLKDRRPIYRAACICGFKSREHLSIQSAVDVMYGHAHQCKVAR